MFFRTTGAAGFFLLAFCFATPSAFAAEEKKGDEKGDSAEVVARIGDKEVITKDEFERASAALEQGRMAMMRQSGQGVSDPNTAHLNHEQRLRILDSLVDSRIVLMMAREAGTKIGEDAVKAEVEKNKTNLPSGTDYATFLKDRGLTEEEVLDRTKQRLEMKAFEEAKTKDVTVTDEEIKTQFDKLKERGIMDDFDVQHILIKAARGNEAAIAEAKTKIDAVHERLKKGEDFLAVAEEVSEDEESKKTGCEYKGIRRGQLFPEFDKRMAAAKVGEASGPFSSPFGWHILRVTRHGVGELTPDIGERIRKQMITAKQKIEMRKLVQEKRSTLNITISLPAEAASAAPAPSGGDVPKNLDSLIDAAS